MAGGVTAQCGRAGSSREVGLLRRWPIFHVSRSRETLPFSVYGPKFEVATFDCIFELLAFAQITAPLTHRNLHFGLVFSMITDYPNHRAHALLPNIWVIPIVPH